jgi:hypothetical protein
LPPAKINPGRCPKKESGLQAFVRQYRDFMQIILLAAAAINLVVTGDVGTRVVRFARLIHRRVRVLGGPSAGATSGGISAALVATQVVWHDHRTSRRTRHDRRSACR